MTSFTFRPAARENVGLLIGLAGGTGSGKSFSALELATGIAGGKPFAVIDTESRRALHYADKFRFDHGELRAPFTPAAYTEAIAAADLAGYPVIVVDSASHEWEGEGGLLDQHSATVEEIVASKRKLAADKGWNFNEEMTRGQANMGAWIEPKMAHKRYVQKLLQLRAHLILCFRAEDKIEMVKEDGKTVVRPKTSPTGTDGWVPICEKRLPFELTCSFLLKSDRPGMPIPIKLQEQHRAMFPLDKPIGRATGEAIAKWAGGTAAPSTALAAVLKSIEVAENIEQLKKIGARAGDLPAHEKELAKVAYAAKQEALKKGK